MLSEINNKMEKRSNSFQNYFIYFAVFAVNIISLSTGSAFSWSSPVIPKLKSSSNLENPLSRPTTTFEDSWIAALTSMGAIVGPLAAGVFSAKFGNKFTLLLSGVPMAVAHIMFAFANNIHFFFAGRFILGIGCGCVLSTLPIYVGEIAQDSNRGVLGCFMGIMLNAGTLFSYIVGPFVSIPVFSVINLIPVVAFYIFFGIFVPETPYYYISRGNQDMASATLIKFRRQSDAYLDKEILCIETNVESSLKEQTSFMEIIKSRAIIKAFVIAIGLMAFQQFSGINAVLGYMQTIFEATGSSIPATYSAIAIGFVQWVMNGVTSQLADRLGRKILLVVSSILSCLSLAALGAFFYLQDAYGNVESISWLPMVSLVLYIVGYNLGLSILPWVMMGELFPSNIKSMACSLATCMCLSLSFVVTIGFPYMNDIVGMSGCFWLFSVILGLGAIFSLTVVIETKGKSFSEIQLLLAK